MLIIGITLLVFAFIVFIFFIINDKDTDGFLLGLLFTIFFILGVAFIIAHADRDGPQTKSTKDFSLKTEIRQEFLNGKEISRDTVYIFTPKKK